jgi:2-isopropylmalate synthase
MGANDMPQPRTKKDNRHIKIFDTTLRDGQQCPGAGMTFKDNLEYARLACELRVDVLEAGFPAASHLDFEIVKTIAEQIRDYEAKPMIAALCQLREEQVIRTIESLAALIPLKLARVHMYLPVDPDLMPISLGKLSEDKKQIIQDLAKFTKIAVDAGCEVEFSPEGYSRMRNNFDFATELFRAAIQNGATVINCPDTIGGACSIEGNEYFVKKMKDHAVLMEKEFPDKNITWSTHCHNDFGLAVQNSINAVFEGPARQIEGCINGTGERAGNAALEQCIMLIKKFGSSIDPANPFYTTIDTSKLQSISDFVSEHMLPRQPHWPISGDNAAKHSSGGHTNAILKNPLAYQPFDPQAIGKKIDFSFGPFSGSNHAKSIIENFGYICSDEEKADIAQFIKDMYSERRKGITDEELLQAYFQFRAPIRVEQIEYVTNADGNQVKLHGQFFDSYGIIEGKGQDSVLSNLKNLIESKFGEFKILHQENRSESLNDQIHHISRLSITARGSRQYSGIGQDSDIHISFLKALIDAVNQAYINAYFAKSSDKSAILRRTDIIRSSSVRQASLGAQIPDSGSRRPDSHSSRKSKK